MASLARVIAMAATIKAILAKGHYVAIEQGCFVVRSSSSEPVPDDFIPKNQANFYNEISVVLGKSILQYQSYSTGRFGVKGFEGVLLSYANVVNGEMCSVFFNAELTRLRTTKHGKQGGKLPKGQFRVTNKFAFTCYWLKLGLLLPQKLSTFHECMGKLKTVLILGQVGSDGRIKKETIKPFSISYDELLSAFSVAKFSDKPPTIFRQASDNSPTSTTDKEPAQTRTQQGIQANSSTCNKYNVLSNQVSTPKADSLVSMNYRDVAVWNPKHH